MNIEEISVGCRIIDESGRIGIVTEVRREYAPAKDGIGFENCGAVDCIFVKPEGVPYAVPFRTGSLIAATAWHNINGRLEGLWYDDPIGAKHVATIVDEAAKVEG